MRRIVLQLAAELTGTFLIVLIAAGAISVDPWLHAAGEPILGTFGAAVAYGLAVAATIEAFGPVSGGHLNPAISIGAWVTRRMSTGKLIGYVAVQLAGSLAAAWLLRAVIPESSWRTAALGSPVLASAVTRAQGMALEAVLTFAMVVVFFRTAAVTGNPSGWAVGAVVAAATMAFGPLTGAALNPARAFGPALLAPHWANYGVWWIGPLGGGVLGAWLAGSFGKAPAVT